MLENHPILHWREICSAGQAVHLARVSSPQTGHWRLHAHDFYECFFIDAGKGWHLVDGSRSEVEEGMLVFIRPEHGHGFQPPVRRVLTLTNIAFAAPVVERFADRHPLALAELAAWRKAAAPTVIRLNTLARKRFDQLVDDLAWGGRGPLDAEFFLAALIRLVAAGGAQAAMREVPDWLQNALLLMEQQEHLQAGVARLVQLSGRTPEHVARSFRRYLQQTPSTWVNQQRVRYARRLLETTDLSIIEVAGECGFDNLSYFHRTFKAVTGRTPLAHRHTVGRTLGVG